MSTVLDDDVLVTGSLQAGTMVLADNAVTNSKVLAGADIAATKLWRRSTLCYSQDGLDTIAAEDSVVHVVYGLIGTLIAIKAGVMTANAGAAVITVDVEVGGASILSGGAYTIDAADSTDIQTLTIDTAALVEDDIIEVVITATAGGGTLGKGVYVDITLDEDPNAV